MPDISGLWFSDTECSAPTVVEMLNKRDLDGAVDRLLEIVEDDTREYRRLSTRVIIAQRNKLIDHDWVIGEMEAICSARRRESRTDMILHYTSSEYDEN